MPSFNILIATTGRPCLQKMINSLITQLEENDCLTIVYDGHSKIPTFDLSNMRCKVIQYFEETPLGSWGHGIRNKYASLLEKRDFIMHADDDNIYYDVFNILRESCKNINTLYIAKSIVGDRKIVPVNNVVKYENIDTSCGIIPFDLNSQASWQYCRGGDGLFYEELITKTSSIEFLSTIIYSFIH